MVPKFKEENKKKGEDKRRASDDFGDLKWRIKNGWIGEDSMAVIWDCIGAENSIKTPY